jgi:hypothetical protein
MLLALSSEFVDVVDQGLDEEFLRIMPHNIYGRYSRRGQSSAAYSSVVGRDAQQCPSSLPRDGERPESAPVVTEILWGRSY